VYIFIIEKPGVPTDNTIGYDRRHDKYTLHVVAIHASLNTEMPELTGQRPGKHLLSTRLGEIYMSAMKEG
jgi:hypothetical protein